MGEPLSSVSVEDRMLVALYNTLTDQPNVAVEGRLDEANGFIREERPRIGADDWSFGSRHFSLNGAPSDFSRPVAHRVLLTSLTHRLQDLGYTVESVTSAGFGYQFSLSFNGRPVSATLYPADLESDGDMSFFTRLEWTAEVLRSPVSATVASVDLESHTQSTTFRLSDGGWILLDDHRLSPGNFQSASRAYRALRPLGGYGEADRSSTAGQPVFSGSILLDAHGEISASYSYPGDGDMPHVGLGPSGDPGDASAIRARFRAAVDRRIGE